MSSYYESLYAKCGDILKATFSDSDCANGHTASHNRLVQLGVLAAQIIGRPEHSVFEAAIREYEYALLAIALGLYRQAYSSLRLYLDLVAGCIYFSGSELEFRQWLKDNQYIMWSVITDDKTGIFSERFVGAFFPDLVGRSNQFKAMAAKLHQECSQYVHGNAQTHSTLPTELSFHRDILLDWHEKAETAYLVSLFVYCVRYVLDMAKAQKDAIGSIVLGELTHIEPIRLTFAEA